MKTKRMKPRDPGDVDKISKRFKDVGDYEPEFKCVFYGKPGTGKTTIAASFPKPMLFIDISEKGTDSIRKEKGVKVIRVKSWDDLETLYWYLKEHEDEFESCAVDTVSGAQELAIKHVLEMRKKKVTQGKIGGWGTMVKKDWGEVASLLKPWIVNMRDLPLNMAFIAHDRVFSLDDEDESNDTTITPTIGPRLMPSVASTLNACVGVIGNTFIRERIKIFKDKDSGKKKERKLTEYCLRVGPHSVFVTKVRKPKDQELAEVMVDPDYESILEVIEGEDK
jgi:hypothetical protein